MRGCAGRQNRAKIISRGEIGDGQRNALGFGRNKYTRLIAKYGVRYSSDGRGDARQAAGRSLKIDQPKPFDSARGIPASLSGRKYRLHHRCRGYVRSAADRAGGHRSPLRRQGA